MLTSDGRTTDAIEGLLSDPLTQLAMRADGVSVEAMRELLFACFAAMNSPRPEVAARLQGVLSAGVTSTPSGDAIPD